MESLALVVALIVVVCVALLVIFRGFILWLFGISGLRKELVGIKTELILQRRIEHGESLDPNSILCLKCGHINLHNKLTCEECGVDISDLSAKANELKAPHNQANQVSLAESNSISCPKCGHRNLNNRLLCEECGVDISELSAKETILPPDE